MQIVQTRQIMQIGQKSVWDGSLGGLRHRAPYGATLITTLTKIFINNIIFEIIANFVQFHHERGLSKSRYLELFFSAWYIFFSIQKIGPFWGPVQPFLNIDHDFGHICFLKKLWNLLIQNLGHNLHKKCKIFRFGNSLSEKQPFTFRLFWTFKNPVELLNL